MESDPKDGIEEGEILDYEPIPRPTTTSSRVQRGSVCKVDSDTSDTDDGVACKRPRFQHGDSKRNKYNIWSSEFEASELIDDLCSWDTKLKNTSMDRSRDVESYYCPQFVDEEKNSEEKRIRKRRYNEKVDLRAKLSRKNSKEESNNLDQPRYLAELRVTGEDSTDDVACDIMNKLCEDNEELITRAVSILGTQKTIDFFKKTRSLEEEGGMMVLNQSRRRTPGGVFIQLIKRDNEVTEQQKQQIFSQSNKPQSQKVRRRQSSQKSKMGFTDNTSENVPQLMSRKELALSLANSSIEVDRENDSESEVKENDCDNVKNPPPSPATVGELLEERQLLENDSEVKDHERNVKNPPPSPATHEERQLAVYDDMFDIEESEMELA